MILMIGVYYFILRVFLSIRLHQKRIHHLFQYFRYGNRLVMMVHLILLEVNHYDAQSQHMIYSNDISIPGMMHP